MYGYVVGKFFVQYKQQYGGWSKSTFSRNEDDQ
jgi:hypothetical protein